MITGGEDEAFMDESLMNASGKYKLGDLVKKGTTAGDSSFLNNSGGKNFSPNTS
jgi:hypothetical protein